MVIAVDVDGVLADFNTQYVPFLISCTGKDLFPAEYDPRHPPCWDYPPHFGYTDAEYKQSWDAIKHAEEFWRWIEPEPGAEEAILRLDTASSDHDVFFITNRMGRRAKQQTEEWLRDHGMQYPTVIVAANKIPVLKLLKASVFVEDRLMMANDVARVADEDRWPDFRMYLTDRTYNREGRRDDLIVVSDINEMLDQEGL